MTALTEMPSITVPHSRVLVNEGEIAELQCEVRGVPQPQLTWHRDAIQVGIQSSVTANLLFSDSFYCNFLQVYIGYPGSMR